MRAVGSARRNWRTSGVVMTTSPSAPIFQRSTFIRLRPRCDYSGWHNRSPMRSILSRVRESALPRAIDRVVGTPVLWLWGAMRRRRPLPAAPRRFGLMMFETIGDTLLAGTVPASLRAALGDCELVVFASRGNRGVLPLFEGIARVVD